VLEPPPRARPPVVDLLSRSARDGDIVVAQVEENAVTLKQFFKESGRIPLAAGQPGLPGHVLQRRTEKGQA